MFHNASA